MKYVRACSHGNHDIDDALSANQAVTDFKGTLQQRSDARYGLHVGLHGVHTELLAATIYQSLKLIINITISNLVIIMLKKHCLWLNINFN